MMLHCALPPQSQPGRMTQESLALQSIDAWKSLHVHEQGLVMIHCNILDMPLRNSALQTWARAVTETVERTVPALLLGIVSQSAQETSIGSLFLAG